MNDKVENRGICNDDKKLAIKNALLATQNRRQNQVLRCYECKIVEKRLNNRQREELEQLFLEGKWFYNHVLNLHQNGQKLNLINTTNIKSVDHYDKDKNLVNSKLNVLSGQQKQAILTRMNQNEKTIATLVKHKKQTHGNLQFKSELNCIPLKQYSTIVIQDEQIANWHKGLFGKQVQHSCMGLIKQKLKSLPQTIVLDKYISTTKWCPKCGKKHSIGLDERTYVCECGYQEDRDVHSAKNMLNIKNMVFSKLNLVPTEHREVTLMEFKTSINNTGSIVNKLEH